MDTHLHATGEAAVEVLGGDREIVPVVARDDGVHERVVVVGWNADRGGIIRW